MKILRSSFDQSINRNVVLKCSLCLTAYCVITVASLLFAMMLQRKMRAKFKLGPFLKCIFGFFLAYEVEDGTL